MCSCFFVCTLEEYFSLHNFVLNMWWVAFLIIKQNIKTRQTKNIALLFGLQYNLEKIVICISLCVNSYNAKKRDHSSFTYQGIVTNEYLSCALFSHSPCVDEFSENPRHQPHV